MSRWLFSAVLALVLCCLGFAAAAQGHAGARQHGCDATAMAAQTLDVLASNALDAGAPGDTGDETPGNDEQRHDCSEILFGTPGLFVPGAAVATALPAPPALRASPFLEHPKRPPRG